MADDIAEPVVVDAPEANLEDAFQNLFKTSASGTGEEELLRIASKFSTQLTAPMIRAVLYLEWIATAHPDGVRIRQFIDRWLELKQYNNSDVFVMKALEHISLRKFINENSVKVNIEK
jgi:hypothetical protein